MHPDSFDCCYNQIGSYPGLPMSLRVPCCSYLLHLSGPCFALLPMNSCYFEDLSSDQTAYLLVEYSFQLSFPPLFLPSHLLSAQGSCSVMECVT